MASNQSIERMSPLDLLMPECYVAAVLTFPTTHPQSSLLPRFQSALDKVCECIPWLKGRVVATDTEAGQSPGREVRWAATGEPPRILDKGILTDVSYAKLAAQNMPLDGIPNEAWPPSSEEQAENASKEDGTPVFSASFFGFAEGDAVGLCVHGHHCTMDGFGFASITRLWSEIMCNSDSASSPISSFCSAVGRSSRLDAALGDIPLPTSIEELWAKHTEYSLMAPSTTPVDSSECTGEVFQLSVRKIDAIKDRLQVHLSTRPSTNSVACALVWSAIMRARTGRVPSLLQGVSKMPMIVNGRKRLSPMLADPDDPYLGNVVLLTVAEVAAAALPSCTAELADADAEKRMASVVAAVAAAVAPETVDATYVREVAALVRGVDDHRTIFPGWELFRPRDVCVTSWADQGFYDFDFGEGLGKPEFVRIPYSQGDGVVVILPRRRGMVDEKLDVIVLSLKEDMEVIRADSIWE